MSKEVRLKATILLVIVCTAAIPINRAFSDKWGELYPFTSWKLFTQPHGISDTCLTYRIYTYQDGEYVRKSNTSTEKGLNRDDKYYLLSYIAYCKPLDSAASQKKFQTLCHFLYPDCNSFQLIEEYYRPSEVQQNPNPHAIKVILTTK